MSKEIVLPLPMEYKKLYMRPELFKEKKEFAERFIDDEPGMKNMGFIRKVLPSNEVQSNNMIEGYSDDIEKINFVVRKKNSYKTTKNEQKRRIINLVNGYNFILKNKEINKQNLRKLYNILSKDLLSEEDLSNMGEYYRKNDVFIYYSSVLSKKPDMGLSPDKVEEYMNYLFDFIKGFPTDGTLTDEFIKSQIMHFYFVYIHPYYDINGRTARTTSIWQLVNEKAYPFIIFNRGIQINKSEYCKVIRDIKKFGNINFFINYMLDSVILELKKEHVMQSIAESCPSKLTATDYQTLHYLLSINGLCTALDFVNIYNNFNDKQKGLYLQEHMLEPLIDKGIIIPNRDTKRFIASDIPNYVINLNQKYIDDSKDLSGISILKKKA